jgi:hypothetical protein
MGEVQSGDGIRQLVGPSIWGVRPYRAFKRSGVARNWAAIGMVMLRVVKEDGVADESGPLTVSAACRSDQEFRF